MVIVNNDAVNMEVQISFVDYDFVSFRADFAYIVKVNKNFGCVDIYFVRIKFQGIFGEKQPTAVPRNSRAAVADDFPFFANFDAFFIIFSFHKLRKQKYEKCKKRAAKNASYNANKNA